MISLFFCFAESEGFKPPIPERGIPDFESSAIDHSANSPNKVRINNLFALMRVQRYYKNLKYPNVILVFLKIIRNFAADL